MIWIEGRTYRQPEVVFISAAFHADQFRTGCGLADSL